MPIVSFPGFARDANADSLSTRLTGVLTDHPRACRWIPSLKRRPQTVYTVSCPPAEAVARCAQFWRASASSASRPRCAAFAIAGQKFEVTVGPGRSRTESGSAPTFFPMIFRVPPSWLLGGPSCLSDVEGSARAAS